MTDIITEEQRLDAFRALGSIVAISCMFLNEDQQENMDKHLDTIRNFLYKIQTTVEDNDNANTP